MQIPVREIMSFKLKQTLNLVIYSPDAQLTHFLLLCIFLRKSRLGSDTKKSLQNLLNLITIERIFMEKGEFMLFLEIYKTVLNYYFLNLNIKSEVTLKLINHIKSF